MRPENRPARILRVLAMAGAAVLLSALDVTAQTAPQKGAAERSGKGWPYPEPAQRGATGYSPDYALYARPSERWDIYANILWRKAVSRNKADIEYYDYELGQFLDAVPAGERARFSAAGHLLPLIEQIRKNTIKLPYRDTRTGCLLFTVRQSGRSVLAADNCDGRD
jgi:hypothetical protein